MYRVEYSLVSNIGKIRKQNQDNFYADGIYQSTEAVPEFPVTGEFRVETNKVLAVFDGMGGEEKGEMASLITSETAAGFDFSGEVAQTVQQFIRTANQNVCRFAQENGIRSTGTTAAMLVFARTAIFCINVGDSPVFLMKEGKLAKLSIDDVAFTVGRRKPPITQNIGIPEEELLIEPHILRLPVKSGQKYLICSDGLTDMVNQERIAEIINGADIKDAAGLLVEEALKNGGHDNVTAICCQLKKNIVNDFLKKVFHK